MVSTKLIHWSRYISQQHNVLVYTTSSMLYSPCLIISLTFISKLILICLPTWSTTYETPLERTRCIILRQSYIHLTQEGVLRSVKCVNIFERVYTLNFASISHISNLIVAIHFYSPLIYKPFKLSLNRYFSSANDFTWRW